MIFSTQKFSDLVLYIFRDKRQFNLFKILCLSTLFDCALVKQQAHVLANPFDYLNTLGMAIVLSGFLMIGYMTLNAMRRA